MKRKLPLAVLACGLFLVSCNTTAKDSSVSSTSDSTSVSTSVPGDSASSSTPTSSSENPVISSKDTNSASSSSSLPTPSENVTLSADKTILALNESAKATIGNNLGDIKLQVAEDSLVEGSLIRNEDGTYTVAKSDDSNYGGIMILNAVSTIDNQIKATLNLKFVASVSSDHYTLVNKTFDRISGTNFAGESFTYGDSFVFSQASDGNYVKLAITLNKTVYKYFSNYDSKFNEIHFASETPYTDVDHKSYNSLTVKLFTNYVEVSSAAMNATLTTSIPLAEDNVTLSVVNYPNPNPSADQKKNTAKVGDSITMTLNTTSNDSNLSYTFVATTGSDAVTISTIQDVYGDFDKNQRKITVNSGAEGKDVVIKASVSNGKTVVDRLFSFTVEAASETPTVTALDANLIGTWSGRDENGSALEVAITSATDIKFTDAVDYGDSTIVFPATNITLVTSKKITCTLGGNGKGDNFNTGDSATLTLDDDGTLEVQVGGEYGFEEWFTKD